MKDETLFIKKAKKGEADAFGWLYDKYVSQIYRFIFLKVGVKQEAEDITHQVFLNAWMNIASYEERGHPFSSWLYRIANNAVIDYYRGRKNIQSLETTAGENLQELPELEKNLDKLQDLKLVQAALARLESDQQNVLIMKFIDDLSNKEIAATLNKSEGAIRVIQHRALKQLKKNLQNSQSEQRPYFI